MYKAYKYRIYPTKEQAEFFEKSFGCCRFVYNRTLDYMSILWIGGKNRVDYYAAKKQLVFLKECYPWLDEVNSQSLQYAVKQCADGFKNWWQKRAKHPHPKHKGSYESFHNPQRGVVNWEKGTISLSKCKDIKAVLHRPFYGTIKDVVIRKHSSGRYYASFLVDTALTPLPADGIVNEDTSIGIDLNVGDIVCSDGRRFSNPKALYKYERRLHKQNRILSKKEKGSKNWIKQKRILAKCHLKVVNIRRDYLDKLTYKLTHESQVRTIFIEDLGVKDMVQDHFVAKSVSDASFRKFVNLLAYKCDWYGVNLIKISRWAPSSKTCSVCGTVKHNLQHKREWTCNCCGTRHERDYNAAVNIKSFGLMALPPDRRKVKPVDCPPVDDRRSPSGLRSSDRMNQEKFRGVTDSFK